MESFTMMMVTRRTTRRRTFLWLFVLLLSIYIPIVSSWSLGSRVGRELLYHTGRVVERTRNRINYNNYNPKQLSLTTTTLHSTQQQPPSSNDNPSSSSSSRTRIKIDPALVNGSFVTIPSNVPVTVSSLKPAALFLMETGKKFARAGECIIDYSDHCNFLVYGNPFSLMGAQIRNSGDNIAQCGASCRYKKTNGYELVVDEIREAATCLITGTQKLQEAIILAPSITISISSSNYNNNNKNADNQKTDDVQLTFKTILQSAVPYMEICSKELEASGEKIMKRVPYEQIGQHFITTSGAMEQLSILLQQLSYITTSSTTTNNNEMDTTTPKPTTGFFSSFFKEENTDNNNNNNGGDAIAAKEAALLASEKMLAASIQMKYAGRTLQGLLPEPSSNRSFLKNQS